MIGDVKGYCQLKSTKHCFIGYSKEHDPDGYNDIEQGLIKALYIPVVDIGTDGNSLLCIEPGGRALVDVCSMADVACWFQCRERGDVVLPVCDDELELLAEMSRRIARKGGYNHLLKGMVILNSLRKGEFNDDFLFAKQ